MPSWVKLHGFGIKVSALKETDARFLLHSADSESWDYERRYDDWLKGGNNGKTWKDKVPNLKSYVARIESMLNPTEPLYAEVFV